MYLLYFLAFCPALSASGSRANLEYAVEFFKRYWHIVDNLILYSKIWLICRPYLVVFQERFNLTVDGELNKETSRLMKAPRCDNMDIVQRAFLMEQETTSMAIRSLQIRLISNGATSVQHLAEIFCFTIHRRTLTLLSEWNIYDIGVWIIQKFCNYDLDDRVGYSLTPCTRTQQITLRKYTRILMNREILRAI